MLKIRVIGTKNEIAWFQNLVRNHLQIEVLDMSKLYISKEASDNYNDSAQKTPAVRKNVRGMNAPITNNATIIPTGFSSGIVGFSWPDVLQNAVIRCIALLFQEKHFQ